MAAQVKKIHKIPFLGPFACHGMIFGPWATLGFIESCIPNWSLTIFHCEYPFRFYLIFACGILILTAIISWITSIIYHPILPFPTHVSELPSACLINCVLGVVSYGLIRWSMGSPNIAERFFDWLGACLLIFGILLMLINHFSRERGQS